MFARSATPNNVANHHDASGYAHASLESLSVGTFQLHQIVDERKRGINGTFSCIFLGLRITKVGKHTIAHELGDKTVKPGDSPSTSVLVAFDQRAHVFRVDLVSQCC